MISTTTTARTSFDPPQPPRALPSGTWRMLANRGATRKLPKGLDAWWDAIIGRVQAIVPRRAWHLRRAHRVVALQKRFANVSDRRLRRRAEHLRYAFRLGREKPAHVQLAFALIREVIERELGLQLHTVQVAAGLAMEAGCIAELATGEGKTLAATLPATLAGWRGRGCHVLTVNDYLAQRDAHDMAKVYQFCGLCVAHIEGPMPPSDRRHAYAADVTYCTNKEVAADFLRDRLTLGSLRGLPSALLGKIAGDAHRGLDGLVMRGLQCAIVDEADSVLIDEAVTPLIISGSSPNAEQVQAFERAAILAAELEPRHDFRVDRRFQEVTLTPAGRARLVRMIEGLDEGIWAGARRREELVRQALTARELYLQDKQYVVHDGRIVIVDEFTGRLMPDRTWRDGLHQAIEAKENLQIQPMKGTLARISFQRFFRLYRKLAGMTGTVVEDRQEIWRIYHCPVVPIPTHRPVIRRHLPDRLLATAEVKWAAIVEEICRVHEQGRPILIGTRSVRASEHLSALLTELGLEHQVLNATRHAEEAQIVAAAGQPGRITVATNMAGRGTDIKPGRGVPEQGGVHVIATERHEAGRIDRQLYGRTSRQGDPGTAGAYLSLEDELFVRYAPKWVRWCLTVCAANKRSTLGPGSRKLVDYVQHCAQRRARAQRNSVLKADDWLEENLGFAGREM
ncbi:MAG: hypothetical protein V3U29_10370 [Phycisphaeraceae bacterium]